MSQTLKAVPVQIIEIAHGVILKRGCSEVKVTGTGVTTAIKTLFRKSPQRNLTMTSLRKQLSRIPGLKAERLIRGLIERRFLVPRTNSRIYRLEPENHLDVFFWHFDGTDSILPERLNKVRIVIAGVNCIAHQLVVSLLACGFANIRLLNIPELLNRTLCDTDGPQKHDEWPKSVPILQGWPEELKLGPFDCLIGTSDLGKREALERLNQHCINENVTFVPVILSDMVGYVGPIIIPYETACYKCLCLRQMSHTISSTPDDLQANRTVIGRELIGFHPSMANILGDLTAFELTRFYSEVLPSETFGRVLQINLLAGAMVARTALKIPRCPACGTPRQRSSTASTQTVLTARSGHTKTATIG